MPAKQGMTLQSGDRIITNKDGLAELSFLNGSVSRIAPNSQIEISQLSSTATRDITILHTNRGEVWSKVPESTKQYFRFEVNTPSAVAGVRGTGFMVRVGDLGDTSVRVYEGIVGLSGRSDQDPPPQPDPLNVMDVDDWEKDNLVEDIPVAYIEVEVETKIILATQLEERLPQTRVELVLLESARPNPTAGASATAGRY
ncbi:FecR domain-containing protein [Heliorestis acidaminivorans]|uniref:FecR domain-containing protein n=1 Tax=Heliorestis acidaminivorans TaxID=553427 RepID=A0A6I0F006_9FIRM|nr:FecR family protein [Heliorestis acidaminivorans]KAB2954256.1 FecR domain-containing protein [Heliorestis acidaminivorans]